MIVGVPKEVKNHEYRVGLTPDLVSELKRWGHDILVERKAGEAIGFMDEHYVMAGASMVDCPKDVFAQADMVIKVKEPQPEECMMFMRVYLMRHQEQKKKLGLHCVLH